MKAPVEDVEDIEHARTAERGLETPETALMAQDNATQLDAAMATLPALLRETLALRGHGSSFHNGSELRSPLTLQLE